MILDIVRVYSGNRLGIYLLADGKSDTYKKEHPIIIHLRSLGAWSAMLSMFFCFYLEVLTAQQSLLNAELTQAQDLLDKVQFQGTIHLYHALGGGI